MSTKPKPDKHFPFADGYPMREPGDTRPRLVIADDGQEMPDPDSQTADQCGTAMGRLDWDYSGIPRFPWGGLDDMTGGLIPGEFWIAAARTGMGKTLFLLNVFDDFVGKQGVSCFYVGLEQTPAEMRMKWACTRLGVPAAGPLGGKWPQTWDARRIQDTRAAIKSELEQQSSRDLRALARFCEARFINAALLKMWTHWAVDHGAEVVIVDHLNRLARDADKSSFDGHSHLVTTAKELAIEHEIVVLAASQVGRPNGDPLQRFTPPALHELRGGGTSEEEANAVLMIYRPLKPTVTSEQMKAVRSGIGSVDEHSLYEENLMAIKVAKHRLLGLQKDQTVLLRVEHGRILNRY